MLAWNPAANRQILPGCFIFPFLLSPLCSVRPRSAGPAPHGAPPLPAHPRQRDPERERHHPQGIALWPAPVLHCVQRYEQTTRGHFHVAFGVLFQDFTSSRLSWKFCWLLSKSCRPSPPQQSPPKIAIFFQRFYYAHVWGSGLLLGRIHRTAPIEKKKSHTTVFKIFQRDAINKLHESINTDFFLGGGGGLQWITGMSIHFNGLRWFESQVFWFKSLVTEPIKRLSVYFLLSCQDFVDTVYFKQTGLWLQHSCNFQFLNSGENTLKQYTPKIRMEKVFQPP